MKFWRFVRTILTVLFVVGALSICWTAAYYISSYSFARIGWQPADLVRQLATSIVGFLIFGCIMALISFLTLPKRMAMFNSIIDAMRRLSRGDFNVTLNIRSEIDNQFGQLVRSFNDMAAQLGAMEKMRQEFISNVSHEIQSPLTSISGFARALRNGRLSDEERAHYLDIVETESMRLSKLSDNLLKLTSLESEHYPFEPKRYRLDKQLREVVLACEPQWLDKSIDMDVCLEEAEIVADPDLLNQVWGNLIHNSIKFTPRGGTISIQLLLGDGEAAVRISDTGIGIGAEELPRIFERFYKADRSRNRTGGGSGLGLAIVKKIVELHRGAIDVQSTPGEGTVFTVRLPAGM
jgi:signal transduction histidine kinase